LPLVRLPLAAWLLHFVRLPLAAWLLPSISASGRLAAALVATNYFPDTQCHSAYLNLTTSHLTALNVCWTPKSWPSVGKDGLGCFRVVEVNAEVNNSLLLLNAGLAHVQVIGASLVQLFSSM
jgi:hypothetical protein